jgi:hypothetical protein
VGKTGMRNIYLLILLFAGTCAIIQGQTVSRTLTGFIRTGTYSEIHNPGHDNPFSSVYADGGFRLDVRNQQNFRAYADIRYRYGSEFRQNVSALQLREAWVSWYSGNFEVTMGQHISKWGRADFDNPTSSFNPRNLVVRSPEKEDMDLGNITASLTYTPAGFLSLQFIVAPFYRPDVLVTAPLDLPATVNLRELDGLTGGKSMTSYGARAEFFLRGIDFSISWFNGNDPLPGIRYDGFTIDIIDESTADIEVNMTVTPYRVKRLGFDFETVAGRFGLRGETAFTKPDLSFRTYGYVPMPEIEWAAGADLTLGKIMLGAEYIGKYITDFEPAAVLPVLPGSMPDLTPQQIEQMITNPGIMDWLIGVNTAAFNRLYMYQLEKSYHSAGLRIEADIANGNILPGMIMLYNITSGDLALVPSVRFRPADGLSVFLGADFYAGPENSLYDIIDRPLSNFFVSFRADF